MVFVVLIVLVLSQSFGYGSEFVLFAVILSVAINIGSYFYGDQLILAMSGAKLANRGQNFDFYTVAENLSIASGLPMPKLYVIEDTAMNAFATGRDPKHAIVVATSGILQRLNRRELEGVIAHELSHVKNYDIRLMLMVTVLVGTLAYLSDWFLRSLWWGRRGSREDRGNGGGIFIIVGIALAILSPILATIIKLSISRQREYLADASGALLTRYPEGLARALEKLKGDREILEAANSATAPLYISNPFHGKDVGNWLSGLFDTHPPIEERIKRLRSM